MLQKNTKNFLPLKKVSLHLDYIPFYFYPCLFELALSKRSLRPIKRLEIISTLKFLLVLHLDKYLCLLIFSVFLSHQFSKLRVSILEMPVYLFSVRLRFPATGSSPVIIVTICEASKLKLIRLIGPLGFYLITQCHNEYRIFLVCSSS